jgi:hypothetical protein
LSSSFYWDVTQRVLLVSYRRFGTTGGGGEIITAVLVKIKVMWEVSLCRLVIIVIFRANSPR